MMNEYIIYGVCLVAVISALFILFTRNILHAAFSLVLTFLSIAILYFMIGAEFIGVTQIMIYVGGIIVLMIFGIMLTKENSTQKKTTAAHNKLMGIVLSGSVFIVLCYTIVKLNLSALAKVNTVKLETIGIGLMNDYILIFELAAVLLLLVLIAATLIAGREKEVNES